MSEENAKEALNELLVTMYGNVVQYADEDKLHTAEKSYYSTRDYALGDTVSCTAEAALENCEQIKSCYPPGTPKSVFENIDQVIHEIRRLERKDRPNYFKFIVILVLIVMALGAAYEYLTHFRR